MPIHLSLGFRFIGARQFDQAIEQSGRLLQRKPNVALAYVVMALAHGEKGYLDEAVRAIDSAAKIDGSFLVKAMAAHAYAAKETVGEPRSFSPS